MPKAVELFKGAKNSRDTTFLIIRRKDNTKKWDTEQITEIWLKVNDLWDFGDLSECQLKPGKSQLEP